MTQLRIVYVRQGFNKKGLRWQSCFESRVFCHGSSDVEESGEEAANTERHQRKPLVQTTWPISVVYPHHSRPCIGGGNLQACGICGAVGMKGGRGVRKTSFVETE